MKTDATKVLRFSLAVLIASHTGVCTATIFSGGVPVAPANAPGDPQLILTSVDLPNVVGMEVREEYDFFLEGTFFNTSTGLLEDYTMNTVDWDVTESAAPAEGLRIDSDGSFVASAYPSLPYPRTISIDALTTEGAPLDSELKPIEYTDSQTVEITRASSDLDFAEWITAETSLTGDDALESANPDDDSQTNLMEFGLDGDPETSDSISGFSHKYDADDEESTFTLTIPKDRDEVTYTVETTGDLSANPVIWTPQTLSYTRDNGDSETWEVVVSGSNTLFGRLNIDLYTP